MRILWTLSERRKSKAYWVCGLCGKPKRMGPYHDVKPCRACTYLGPAKLSWGNTSLRSTKKVLFIKESLKPTERLFGVSFRNLVRQIIPPRIIEPSADGWLTHVFMKDKILVGTLDSDICLYAGVAEDLEEYMNRKRMMQVRIEEDLHAFLKDYAAKRGVTMTAVIVAYLSRLRLKYEKETEVIDI